MGNLQRIKLLQTLVSIVLITTLGIVFQYNSFELMPFKGSIKSWVHSIEINSILYITATILSIAYLFVRNLIFIPSFIAILLPILAFVSPHFRHPVFFLIELNVLSLIVFPLFYYKYRDLSWISEINRYLYSTFLFWISFLGASEVLGFNLQQHLFAPSISIANTTMIGLSLFCFFSMMAGAILLFFKPLYKFGNWILLIGLISWLISRLMAGSTLEAIPLTFLVLQHVILMSGMKTPLLHQSECFRNGLFKLLMAAAVITPFIGFSSQLTEAMDSPSISTEIDVYKASDKQAYISTSSQKY